MHGMRVLEIPVPLIYLDLNRSFGGSLDQAEVRLAHYNQVIENAARAMKARGYAMPDPRVRMGDCS